MTVSSADLVRALVAGLALSALAVAAPVHAGPPDAGTTGQPPAVLLAQSSGPIRLAPLPDAPSRQVEEPSPAPGPASPTRVAPGRSTTIDGEITVRGLGAISRESVGLLNDERGGLGQVMWAGTDRAQAIRLVHALPAPVASKATSDLARRLLLTSAEPPAPAAVDAGEASLLAARLDALIRIGRHADASLLAATVAGLEVPDTLAEPFARLRFLQGEIDSGCRAVDQHRGAYDSIFWQKAQIVCQIGAGETGQAGLGLDLLREQGIDTERDPLFFTLATAAIVDRKPSAEVLGEAAPLDAPGFALLVAAARAKRASLPAWLAGAEDPEILRAVMDSPVADDDLRLAAAHAAMLSGAATVEEVYGVYDLIVPGAETVATALSGSDDLSPDRRIAYLVFAARRQASPVARSEALSDAWETAARLQAETGGIPSEGFYELAARLTAPLLADVPTGPAFGWISGQAARAAFAGGDHLQGLSWYRLAERQAPNDPAIREAVVALWPVARLVSAGDPMSAPVTEDAPGGPGTTLTAGDRRADARARAGLDAYPFSDERLDEWIAAQSKLPGAGARVAAVLALLEAMGDRVPSSAWARADEGDREARAAPIGMPAVSATAGLKRAVAEGRRAETVLYGLIAIGEGGPARAWPGVTAEAVQGLREVGLPVEAAAIARESALAQIR